jgi:RNA polymerase sigma-70 factor (ECF subfamily)
LTERDFVEALHRSAAARFSADGRATAADVEGYLDSLFVEDLALASACHRGDQSAWGDLLDRYRPALLKTARALTRDEVRAQELTNGLYADLYGLEEKDGERRSLFVYFHGRSSLAAWLRSVVARAYVDQHRAAKRGETLRGRMLGEMQSRPASASDPPEPERARHLEWLAKAFSDAVGRLAPRDRLRLSYYYLRDLKLAEIGRLLGEHESTVSRKLEQARQAIRSEVEEAMGRECGMSPAEVRDCYEAALDDGIFDFKGLAERVR